MLLLVSEDNDEEGKQGVMEIEIPRQHICTISTLIGGEDAILIDICVILLRMAGSKLCAYMYML